jgi:uncharacterized phage protein gp47/JayE
MTIEYGVVDTGFRRKPYDAIKQDLDDAVRSASALGPEVNTGSASVVGQLLAIFAERLASVWEALEDVYASQYREGASGAALTSACALTGTDRAAATATVVDCTVNVDPGTYAAGTLTAALASDATVTFTNTEAVTNSGGSAANVTGVEFECTATGPIAANAGTVTVIASPVSGWNSVTNPLDGTPGSDEESDGDLRLRAFGELESNGAANAISLRADLLELDDVTSVVVLENRTNALDVNAVPAHSLEAIVYGGDNEDIAAQILASTPLGIWSHGSEDVDIEDSAGETQTIHFSRPTARNVYITVELTIDAALYPSDGDDQIKAAIIAQVEADVQIGDDVILSRVYPAVFSVAGVLDVTAIKAGFSASPSGTVNLSIGTREIADFDTSRIVVTTTEA